MNMIGWIKDNLDIRNQTFSWVLIPSRTIRCLLGDNLWFRSVYTLQLTPQHPLFHPGFHFFLLFLLFFLPTLVIILQSAHFHFQVLFINDLHSSLFPIISFITSQFLHFSFSSLFFFVFLFNLPFSLTLFSLTVVFYLPAIIWL